MLLKNAVIYDDIFEPRRADIFVDNERIKDIGDNLRSKYDCGEEIDLSGLTLLPGFIDIHIHGCNGGDMDDATIESVKTMSTYLAKNGVTSFCPTSMTLPESELKQSFSVVEHFKGNENGAYIHGINMEGPFISHEKKGAQPGEYIRLPDIDEFTRLNNISKISLVDVAPEVLGAFEFAKQASKFCTVSAAHTNADYDVGIKAYRSGFSHATHLFNAMPAIFNRSPGIVTSVFDSPNATAELICDGFHLNPAILRMSFKLLGEDRAVVVSDAMKAAGCADGEYVLGGQTVYVSDGRATLANGSIAASTTNLFIEFKNLLRYGIPFKSALKACTINPARVIDASSETGSLKAGKSADIIAVDESNNLKLVIIKGKIFYH